MKIFFVAIVTALLNLSTASGKKTRPPALSEPFSLCPAANFLAIHSLSPFLGDLCR